MTHPSNITSGTTSVSVSTGVNNTLVAITYNNVIYGRAFTNSSGNATITLTSPPTGVLNYTITATAHNRVTYVGTIAQTVASGPWMEVTAANFDDANNDVPEYNESGYFDVTFKNSGTSAASSVSATLSCATSGISVTDASHSISSLAAGASTTADNAYAITIANNVANGTVAEFTVIMTMSGYGPWTYNFSKTINAPALAFGNMTISDPSGDNDGLLDPGETATVSIVLNNSGAAASLAGTGTLSCGTSGITVVNGSASFSAISAGGYATLSFTVTAASSMTEGTLAAFVFNAVAGQYSANTTVNVEVGAPLQVIIGNGTSTQSYPIDRYYNYSGQEAIYLASEIGTPGTIKSIGFYKASGTDVNTIEAVTVYMKNTSSTTLSTGNYSTSGYTQVYSGTWPNTATSGWMEVNLQNQFAYDGSNLSILTIKGYQYWTSNYPMWTYTTSSATRARQNRSDDAQPTSLTASTNLPNLKLALYPSSGGTEPPTISVNDDSMYAYLQIGTTGTDSFTITNTGEQTLNYNIGIEELSGRDFTGLSSSKGEKDRSIAGSTLTVNATDYIPGSTANWTFTVTNNSTDNEWMQDVIISFPAGVTVNSATNFVGGNGGDMTPNVTSGNGVTITWHGETSYGYGVIYPDESASATVNVTIGAGFGGNLTLPWTLNGDVYGSDPHTLSGSIVLPSTGSPDPVWYSAAPLSGSIAAGQSETVTVYFSAEDMAAESYYADLTITSNAPLNPTLVVELQMDVWDEVVTDPLIAVNPASVSETAVEGNSTTATVTVTNPGTAALTWSTPSSFAAWGTVSPASGTVAAGGNTVLTLTLNAAALTAGSYNANMVISSNAANEPSLTVPVSLTVEAYVEPSDIRFIAEWEPATGTIIAYSGGFGLPYSMIADLSTRGEVYVLVTSSTQSTASSLLSSNGVTMSNVSFIVRDGVNTYWTRDYGPWSIFDANGEMAIVDFRYNRPRPYDNAVNAVLDDQFSFGYYYMPLVATGGNVMTDGQGKMMSTNLIQTENDGSYNPNVTEYDYTLAEIEDLVEDYLGVEQYFMYADPLSNSSIDHIDCHAKLLDVDKVMIARVPSGHANYTALENVVDYWETKTSSYGTPYQIFRVDQTSSNEPYSNAFVFNNKIYVPQWNSTASAADLAAVAAYQAAMPGYTVQGYYNSSWLSDDAVHCRVNTVFDEQMIHLAHVQPTSATANSNVTLDVEITHSNSLNSGSTYIAYRHSTTGQWLTVPLTLISGDDWTASVPTPALGQTLYYYILATDNTARTAKMPLCGADDPLELLVDTAGSNTAPTIALPASFTFAEDGSLVVDFIQYVDDVDGDPLTLSYSGDDQVNVAISGLSVTFTADAGWYGTDNISFTVSDGTDTASDNVNVIVTSVTDPAEIVVAPLSLAYGAIAVGSTSVKTFTITNNGEAALSGSITTPTGYSVAEAGRSESLITEAGENLKTERNTLSFSVAAGITKTYNLSFAPTAVASYNGNVEVSSNDPANPLVYIAVTGSGYDANTVPTITLPASFTFAENGSLVVDFSAYVDDAETNDSGLSLSYSGNTNVNVDISGLSVTFTATTDWYGTENLSFTVSDGELTASDNVDVIVTQVLAPPAISVDDNTMYAYLQTGSTGTDSFTITNTGEQTLTYSIAIEELRGSFATANSSGRSIDGSTLTLDATDYTPGTTLNWTFTVTNNSTDTEWMQDVIVTFPTGVTVNSATNFVGGDGGDLTPDVTSGNGVTVTWHGEDTSGWGLIYGGGDSATATVNVTIASGFSGDLGLPWTLNGDFYGSEPHTLSGSIVLPSTGNPDPEWYSAAPLSGSIAAGQSETVIVYFSAVDTAVGSYYADLTITSNDPVNPTLVVDLQMDVWDEVLTEPLIAADPASVSGTADAGASTTATLTLSNTGSANLTWSTPASFAAWGTVTPVSGTILPGANTVLTITLDAASLAAGSYSSSLVITSNAANTPSLSVPVSFTVEALPYPANPRFVAEWEPAQGAIVRYPLGQPYSLLADISEETMLYVVVASGSQSTAASALSANGVNMANVAYINASTDSYWIRDYGPWFIFDGGELKVVDFEYNRPRPNDDIIPVTVANYFGLDYYTMDLVATGGNIMCDGHEAAMSTQLIAEENTGYTEAEIEALMEQYLGVTDYQLFTDPNNTYIDHIDCWGKLLDVDKVVIRSVPTNHAQYDEIEATVDEWEAKTSGYGTPYQIFRVYTPNDEPYTNSFILNQNIYVPLMGTANDAAAIAAYQAAMPGYTVTGYTYTNYESTDALHCRINTIFDEQMIHAWHVPPTSATANSSVTLNVEITHSNPLDGGSTYIAYRHSTTGEWLTVPLTLVSGNIWTASVPTPALGQTLYYYILATDTTDRTATLPLCGADDPYEVLVDIPGANTAPTIALPETLEFDMNGSLVVDFSQYVDDVDGDPLTLNYSGNTNVSVSIDGLSVTFTATQDWDGSENLTFTVSDGQENANDTVTVTVNFVNHAPTLTLPVEGFEFYMNATLEVDFSPYIEDLDGHTVTLTVGDSDYIEAAIVGHMVTFSAPTDWFGFETLNFVVDDGYAVGFASVEVRVILNHLAIPDIAISYVDAASDYVKVEWAAIPNANYYQVWASEDPYGTYTFLGETTDAWWYDMDLSHAMRFYKIIASDESYLITK